MKEAIGLVEVKSVARGIEVADAMLKSGRVELLLATTVCPGKYIVMVAGDVGGVNSAVQAGRNTGQDSVVDDVVLPHVHPAVFPALMACTEVKAVRALGVIEVLAVASAIIAADAAVKAAPVELMEIRLARGMGGKALVTLTGDVGAVTAAVRAGSHTIMDTGFLVNTLVLPAPHPALHAALV